MLCHIEGGGKKEQYASHHHSLDFFQFEFKPLGEIMSFSISLDFDGPSRLFHIGTTWLSGVLYLSSGTINYLFRRGKYENIVFWAKHQIYLMENSIHIHNS